MKSRLLLAFMLCATMIYSQRNQEPNIQVYNIDRYEDRSMTLQHTMHNRNPLADNAKEVMKHLHYLWQFPVILESVDIDNNIVSSLRCPDKSGEQAKD